MDAAWGPEPTPTRGLSAARARVAEALERFGPDAALAAIADELGGHPNATRQHLDALVADGLATVAERHGPARGRPARVYTLTAAGRRALAGPVAPVIEVLDALATHLAEAPDAADQGLAIGRRWGSSRRGDRRDLLATLDELGFSPEASGPAGAAASIRLRTCPMLDAARACPEVVCAIHAGLVEGALAEPSDGVRVLPFAERDCCVIELPPPPADAPVAEKDADGLGQRCPKGEPDSWAAAQLYGTVG